jgi:protein disulfide-isomerase A6
VSHSPNRYRFYAPWCGHCKSLKPAYETAAKSLAGIAKVAAVNCDEEMNKPFCGSMGVQGFPTLKIVRPGKKPGKPTVEDYQGERSAKGIVNAVKDKVPNSVKRINDKSLDEWLQENKDSAKAILFSDKGVVSATMKALAIDFAGLVSVAQIKKSEKATVEKYGITKYPSLILLQPGTEEPIKFDGKVEKEAMVKFLSQVAPPRLPARERKEGEEGHQEGIKIVQQVRQGLCLAQIRRRFLRRCISHGRDRRGARCPDRVAQPERQE